MSSPDRNGAIQPPERGGVCCRRCEDKALEGQGPFERMTGRTFIVCLDCGNKRCPKATSHEHACTGSNASGQPGSDYAATEDS